MRTKDMARWGIAIMVVLMALIIAVVILTGGSDVRTQVIASGAASMVMMTFVLVFAVLYTRQMRVEAAEAELTGQCPRCKVPLGADGACPQCGTRWSRDKNRGRGRVIDPRTRSFPPSRYISMARSPGLWIISESISNVTCAWRKSEPSSTAVTLQGTICIQWPRCRTMPSLRGVGQYLTRDALPETDLDILTDASVVRTYPLSSSSDSMPLRASPTWSPLTPSSASMSCFWMLLRMTSLLIGKTFILSCFLK